MTRAMTKVAPSWRKVAMTAAMVIGMAGSARAFAPAQPVSPAAPVQQPGSPPAPASSATAQPAPGQQPGYSPAPVGQPGSPPPGTAGQDYPPQYPPQPPPEYPQGPAASSSAPQQGYPQQYPQQGYPQQYPQQGYPQQYPQQGYPPQPYGQGYPPPGYYPQGYPVPPPPPPPSTRPHGHGALLLLPYLGVQANEGSTGQDQNAGFRMGGLIGYRSSGQFSFNGELTLDVLNLKNAPTDVDLTGAAVDLAFSPLFHFDAAALELVVGPKLGVGVTVVQAKDAVGTTQSSTTGFAYGANLGAFLPLGNGASLGALISFEVRTVSQVCAKGYTGGETCVDASANSDKILGVTGAALF